MKRSEENSGNNNGIGGLQDTGVMQDRSLPFSSFLTSSLIFSRSSGSVGSPLELGIVSCTEHAVFTVVESSRLWDEQCMSRRNIESRPGAGVVNAAI